jgi:cytochrome c-type biogenesis protein CcmF
MNVGQLLVGLAFLSALGGAVLLARDYLRAEDRYGTVVYRLVAATALATLTALCYLTYQFVATEYSNAYVWGNTADYLPLLYRVTGVYAGNEGSVLLWATLVSLVALWAASFRGLAARSTKLVQGITMATVAYFAGMLVLESPFASIHSEFPDLPPGVVPASGSGLNPLLVDPYMAIHPPVMFVSYALLTMPFAIGAAHFVSLLRGDGGIFSSWLGSVTRWLRVSWLFLTSAVALGGLWSYTVLGWGGIWAWDPVETAILVPWLFLTATLHAVTNYERDGEYAVLAPAMTATVFALAVYTTSVVRSGVFRSVHSFASGGIGLPLLVLMVLTGVLGVGVPFGYWLTRGGEHSDDEPGSGGEASPASATGNDAPADPASADDAPADPASDDREWVTRSNLLHLAVLLLGLLTFVSMWGLTFPVLRDATTGIEVSVEPKYYNLWSYPIVLGALLLLGFYMDFDVEGKRRSLVGLGVFATATVAAAVLKPSAAWQLAATTPGDALVYRVVGSASALSAFPPVAYVGVGVIKRGIERVGRSADRDFRLKEGGIVLIHLGAALLVLSLTFTYLFTGQASVIAAGVGPDGVDTSMRDVPDSPYSLRVVGYSEDRLPRNPDPGTYALSTDQVIARGSAANATTQVVHGTVTNVRDGQGATVLQLDGSGVWIGLPGTDADAVNVSEGQSIVARGLLLWDFVPQADAMLLTNASALGTTADPPESVGVTRVRVRSIDLVVYEDGRRVAGGTAGQRRYLRQSGMQVRDVLVDRGLVSDTYVIAGVSDGTASITVKRIPMMTAIRISILSLLSGMVLVLVFDPAWGIRRVLSTRDRSADDAADPTTSD